MTQKSKLLNRLCETPADFTWDELVSLMGKFGWRVKKKSSRTGGSRRRFIHETYAPIILHEPHPQPCLKKYQIEIVLEALKKEGIL